MTTRNDSAIFKVFLRTDNSTEVKKFAIDGDTSVITNFIFMREKLQMVFPRLRESDFRITWKDAEGDEITIETDEDLIIAFLDMNAVKTLYVTPLPPQYHHQGGLHYAQPHGNVVCDVCNKTITAYRYKCIQCYDYDLCADCEHAGHHSEHVMMRTSTPELPFARCGRRIFEQVNKAVKKANHTAYKEYKKRWPKGSCDRRRFSEQQQQKPGESSSVPTNEETSQQPEKEAQSCPFEDYIPNLYPILDAIANAATNTVGATANVAATAANASQSEAAASKQPKASGADPSTFEQDTNAAAQFMEAVRNAFSAFVVHPPQSQNKQQTGQQSQQTSAAPNNTVNIDLTRSEEPMDVTSSQREPGWTILSNEETQQQPLLIPTVVPPPQSAPTTQPLNPTAPAPQQLPQQLQSQPLYPSPFRMNIQDPKIAVGLSQLMEMGFSDEPGLVALLRRYDGNVDDVIKCIFENK